MTVKRMKFGDIWAHGSGQDIQAIYLGHKPSPDGGAYMLAIRWGHTVRPGDTWGLGKVARTEWKPSNSKPIMLRSK